ncbi:hypothetical protein P2G88_18845 [Aliiglaciecola sp. CAU 1673]|uniref:hypothetical protein n=1 Tax=Aliiglaciecola sp. CAU 1673 TaxID=3032595 RepID=UPI0023DCA85C|nr:hypothetical protein [Aliiglaciecola sp. CAU 1673]MDF2180320.1 hypothetical protein [Aliiglaciecola sp. CAU 1673]
MFKKMTIAVTFVAASSFINVAQAQELPSLNELASNLLSAAVTATMAEMQRGIEETVIEAGEAMFAEDANQELTAADVAKQGDSEGKVE